MKVRRTIEKAEKDPWNGKKFVLWTDYIIDNL